MAFDALTFLSDRFFRMYYILLAARRQLVAIFCPRSSLPAEKVLERHVFHFLSFELVLGRIDFSFLDVHLRFLPSPLGSSSFGTVGSPDRLSPIQSCYIMEASFWTTMESYPQQATLGIINMLISRRTLMDSISRTLEVLYEMPYTTDFPPGLPTQLEQILRGLHASTERLMDEVTRTNRLLHRLAMFPPHALPTQPWLPDVVALPHYPPPYGPADSPSGTSSTS